jgi:DNA-binding MarR family transcriptional regulator
MRAIAVRIIVIIVIGCLSGCSLFYSYRNIERLIRWSIDDYVSWTPTQAEQLQQRLRAQLQWHQREQLPLYRAWLETLRDEVKQPLELSRLQEHAQQLQIFWQDSMAHGEADIAVQLADLSEAQVRDLIAKMRSDQSDIEHEYNDLSRHQLIERRERSMTKTVRYLIGSPKAPQRDLIEQWAKALPDSRQQWLASRRRWTDMFEQALQQRHQPDIFAEDIHRLFVLPQQNWDPAYRELSEHNLTASLQLVIALQHSLDEAQRKALDRCIEQWLVRLDDLAKNS